MPPSPPALEPRRWAKGRVGRFLPASYARGSGPTQGKDVVVMVWRGRRTRGAGGWRWLGWLGVAATVVMVGRGQWPRIAAGWRWLTGPGWDSKQVEELYGKQTNRGYGGGLADVVGRRESSPLRPQRAAPVAPPDAEP
jgi:hypothetical protein